MEHIRKSTQPSCDSRWELRTPTGQWEDSHDFISPVRLLLFAAVVAIVVLTAFTGWSRVVEPDGERRPLSIHTKTVLEQPTPPPLAATAPTGASVVATSDQISKLKAAITTGSYKVRLQAIMQLGDSGQPRMKSLLIARLRQDDHHAVRAAAAMVLGEAGWADAVPDLIVANALDPAPLVRDQAASALNALPRKHGVPMAMSTLVNEDPAVRRAALSYLVVGIPKNAEGALIRALGDVDEVRAIAKRGLADMAPQRSLSLLRRAADHPAAPVRANAVRILGDLGTTEAAEIVMAVFARDAEAEKVRAACESALRSMRDSIPMERTVRRAAAEDATERAAAIRILGAVGGEAAREAVLRALTDEDIYVRGTAAMAVSALNDVTLLPQLDRVANDPTNQRIAHLVHHAIKQLRSISPTP